MESKQKSLPKEKQAETESPKQGGIVATDSWLNAKGKAVYVNIPEKDVVLTDNGEYGRRLVFITSVEALRKIVAGEAKGANLGKFAE